MSASSRDIFLSELHVGICYFFVENFARHARLECWRGQNPIEPLLNVCDDRVTLNHFRLGERPRRLDRDRDLERPARRELRRPSHGSPGPEILICGIGAGGEPVVLSRARRHFNTGMRRSP